MGDNEKWIQREFDDVKQRIEDFRAEVKDSLKDYGRRIGSLENWRSWVWGAAAAAGFIGGWLATWLRGG